MDLKGKVVLVTGGARRIGRSISLALGEKGANVIINYNASAEQAEEAKRKVEALGARAMTVQADVSKAAQVDRMVDEAVAAFGRIDVLINNAAIFYKTPFLELTEEHWDDFMSINLKGPFLCARKIGELMLKQGSGKIINIADVSGVRPWAPYIPYCVSKAGVIMLTKVLAKALAPNIQVNAVSPGPVLLPEYYGEKEAEQAIKNTVLKRVGSPEDIARTVIFLIEGSDYITGEVIAVDGGRLIA